jgi:hypothetical protein
MALAGIPPLADTALPAGEREVRLWIGGGLGWPQDLYRIRDGAGGVTGEIVRYWPATVVGPDGRSSHEVMVADLRDRCEDFVVAGETGLCRATFTRSPDWADLLGRAEERGLWTLPDTATPPPPAEPEPGRVRRMGDTLPPLRVQLDGWGVRGELRDGSTYRSFRYRFPLDTDTPEGRRAGDIAMEFRRLLWRLSGPPTGR